MEVKTPKDLAKIADIARKKGIKSLKISENSIEFTLGDLPTKAVRVAKVADAATPQPNEHPYSPEDLLFWSSEQAGA